MLSARPSTWIFDTSQSLNVSGGTWWNVSKEDGTIWLNKQRTLEDKENVTPYSFDYQAIGVGVGLGTVPVSFSPKFAPNVGQMFMLDAFVGKELTADDITGICRIQEISGYVGVGGTATALFLGIKLEKLATAVGSRVAILTGALGTYLWKKALTDDDVDWTDLITTGAQALLLIAGPGGGAGKGVGISDAVGYLEQPWEETHIPKVSPAPDQHPAPEDTTMRVQNREQEDLPPIVLEGSNFDTGFDTLKPSAVTKLQEAKSKLAPYSGRFLVVEGYTDNVGHGTYDNQGLSERRANRVKQWLITNANRKDSDVIAHGYGEQYPVASNNDERGREKNRRVEIHIMQAGWKPR